MARNDPQVNLRMSAEMKDKLDAAAVSNKRSLTAEIVERLDRSFTEGPDLTMALTAAQLDAAHQAVQADFLKLELISLAEMAEAMLERADREKFKVVNDEERVLLFDAFKEAAEQKASNGGQMSKELTDRLRRAAEAAKEARYRFLESRGVKGVRQAKV
ncbi:Arc family DNA-binding protein [Variovorax sp. PBL-E5]|uniref:Arc family DNA-binding protein n=1 Tax=Variovorax sp. PBL-E5 TaxID=434014 RepID=UPI001318B2B7|nr:Arc family DNA-binding protein [Variovorax sp. PBL-E5]VTU37153.1 Mnt [Variovorax sp. PBL-E5]